jgi:Ni/Co efflux regulator RcnB
LRDEKQSRNNARRNNQRSEGDRVQRGQQGNERGAGPDHAFYRGERLPPTYRSRQYVVDDWRGHGLHSPPRGYHWVQTGGDYVLVAIATGVILELLLDR